MLSSGLSTMRFYRFVVLRLWSIMRREAEKCSDHLGITRAFQFIMALEINPEFRRRTKGLGSRRAVSPVVIDSCKLRCGCGRNRTHFSSALAAEADRLPRHWSSRRSAHRPSCRARAIGLPLRSLSTTCLPHFPGSMAVSSPAQRACRRANRCEIGEGQEHVAGTAGARNAPVADHRLLRSSGHWWLRPLPCRPPRRALRCPSSVRPGTATPPPEAAVARGDGRYGLRLQGSGSEKHPETRNHRKTSAGIRLAQVQPPTRPPHVNPHILPRHCPRTITQPR